MYRYEAELEMRRDPESLVGQFGFYYVVPPRLIVAGEDEAARQTQETVMWGALSDVAGYLGAVQEAGAVPYHQTIERLSTADQAERYADRERHTVRGFVSPQLEFTGPAAFFESLVPDGTELLTCQAQVWHEWRVGFPKVFSGAVGRLVKAVTYRRDEGWLDVTAEAPQRYRYRPTAAPAISKQ